VCFKLERETILAHACIRQTGIEQPIPLQCPACSDPSACIYSCWEHRKETIMLALFGVIEVATWMAHESPSQPRNQYGCTLNHV
jgi:hypothetical protein